MAVFAPVSVDGSIAQLAARLSELVGAGAEEPLTDFLRRLVDDALQAIGGDDVAAVALQRDRLDRIARSLHDAAEEPLVHEARGYLRCADDELDRARTRMLGALGDRRRAEEAPGVRDRVLAALDRPRRPRELAAELGVEPSQISRALGELTSEGRVARSDPPAGAGSDARAHWYVQAQLVAAVAAQQPAAAI